MRTTFYNAYILTLALFAVFVLGTVETARGKLAELFGGRRNEERA